MPAGVLGPLGYTGYFVPPGECPEYSRSMGATGPGSDNTGFTAGHHADTGYSWFEGRSVQCRAAGSEG